MQIMQILRFYCNYALEIPAALIQVTFSAANIRVTIFIVIMQAGVSVAIMEMVFSAMHDLHDCFYRPFRNSREDYVILLCRHYRRNV